MKKRTMYGAVIILAVMLFGASLAAAQTHIVRVAGTTFLPANNATAFFRTSQGYIIHTSGNVFYRSLPVPDGATLQYVTFHYRDYDETSNSVLDVYKVDAVGNRQTIVELISDDFAPYPDSTKSALLNEVIDYSQNSYMIEWDPAPTDDNNQHQLWSVEVEFSTPGRAVVIPLQ